MKTMTPSVVQEKVTDQQIDKATDVFRSIVRKHREEFPSDAMQQALGTKGLTSDLLGIIRKYVEMFVGMIVRLVNVDRTRSPQQALDATKRKQYVNSTVVASMPHGEGDEVKVVFFKLDLSQRGSRILDDDLEKEYVLRGLKPADPYSLAMVNEVDSAFADQHPNPTHWKDSEGKWCYAAFRVWDGERFVSVNRHDFDWGGGWWFAGLAN